MVVRGRASLFDFLASLKLAVFVLTGMSVALAVGTVIYTNQGEQAAREAIYDAWWFDALNLLLALNVLFAALKRWPWKRRHIGFVTVHAGIIIILVGAFISRRFGVEGQLQLAEGESGHELVQPRDLLRVQVPAWGLEYEIKADWPRGPLGGPPWRFRLKGLDAELVVEQRLSHAFPTLRVESGGSVYNPAIRYRLAGPMAGNLDGWLVAQDNEQRRADLGPLTLTFTTDPHEAGGEAKGIRGRLRVSLPGGEEDVFDVDHLLREHGRDAAPAAIAGSSWAVRIIQYLPHAVVDDGTLTTRSEEPLNPFVRVHLLSPAGAVEEHLVFANFPDFATLHGRTDQGSGATLRYLFDASRSGTNHAKIVLDETGQIQLVLPNAAPQTMALGRPQALPWAGLSLTIEELVFNARTRDEWVKAPGGQGMPVIRATLRHEGEQASEWLVWGRPPVGLAAGGLFVRAAFESRRQDLGFAVRLLNFENPKYGGTTMAARYYSEVEVIDDMLPGGRAKHTIAMNEPLDHRGFRVFQSGFHEPPNGPQISVFSVARDPGTPVVYTGCIVLVAGIALIFWLPSARMRSPVPVEHVS